MTAPSTGRPVNVQKLGVTWWKSQMPAGTKVGTRVPTQLEGTRFVWVQRRPGVDDWNVATARLELHGFAPNEDDGWTLAAQIHDAARALDGQTVAGQAVYAVRCASDPTEQFWSPTVFRTVAVYELDLPVL